MTAAFIWSLEHFIGTTREDPNFRNLALGNKSLLPFKASIFILAQTPLPFPAASLPGLEGVHLADSGTAHTHRVPIMPPHCAMGDGGGADSVT